MPIRHMLSLSELSSETVTHLVNRGFSFAAGKSLKSKPLVQRAVGIYFRRPSTRTRTAFTIGAINLGATVIAYGPNDLQLNTGEAIKDTSRVLSGFLDALVIRTNDSVDEMMTFASQSRMAIINAMNKEEHPTQAIADLITLREEFGRLDDLHLLYIGEGNNTASALAFAISKIPGMRLSLITPEGYGLPNDTINRVRSFAERTGASVEQHFELDDLPKNVDVVYTTRWQTMGDPKPHLGWEEKFKPYKVTPALMRRVSKPSGTIFLHDLPAVRGGDVDDEVLDGPQSRAFRQAQHKLTGAMVVLDWCLNEQ
jgi:ornithine carbamoyltransferase